MTSHRPWEARGLPFLGRPVLLTLAAGKQWAGWARLLPRTLKMGAVGLAAPSRGQRQIGDQ